MITLLVVIMTGSQARGSHPALLLELIHQITPHQTSQGPHKGHTTRAPYSGWGFEET